MKIGILGGGPGGLFLARLVKRKWPAYDVTVYEQNPRDATYGFGVGISMAARDRMRDYDPALFDQLQSLSSFNNRQLIRRNDESVLLEFAVAGGAIRRLDLLRALSDACIEAGVTIHYGQRVSLEELEATCDMVVASDGARSSARAKYGEQLQSISKPHSHHYAWFGVETGLAPSGLSFIDTDAGLFIGHYYAYGPTLSTFLPECDEATWQRSGLSVMTDPQRKQYVESIFAKELRGFSLIENNSFWRTFTAAYSDCWHHENVVLIGDALRIAHFSIGSGTRLAMEDSMALFDAMEGQDSVEKIFNRFQTARRPVRDKFGDAAERSIDWYESLPSRMQAPMLKFVHSFLTRTGRINDERLATYAPGFYNSWREYIENKEQNVQEQHTS